MNIPDDAANAIMRAAAIFQTQLTRKAAKLAEDAERSEVIPEDVKLALALILSRDAADNWTKP
jgi:histone H3/H4